MTINDRGIMTGRNDVLWTVFLIVWIIVGIVWLLARLIAVIN